MKQGMFFGLFLLISAGFLASAFLFAPAGNAAGAGDKDKGALFGGDSDEHGCKASAGYSWCEAKGKCLRVFEEPCAYEMTQETREKVPSLGGDRDERGCLGSAGYSWCESKGKCIRMWEEECACGGAEEYGCPVAYKCDAQGSQAGKCVSEN